MINNVTLVGRLTKDPDLRYTASGTAVATFTLAVNRNFTNQNGNREADFINCVIWRKPAETMVTLAKKGSLIGVVGRIQTRTY
ncbi:TPA: single-stranded DNA-binding protein, partial [Enterococcus faecium]